MTLTIISGGQTGVDRAALDAALYFDLPCGGWCPKGRKAEDGKIPAHYPLKETFSRYYRVRTEKNVIDSHGTLILKYGQLTGGTALTVKIIQDNKKPFTIIDLMNPVAPIEVVNWIKQSNISVLNVAGPRGSHNPKISTLARQFMDMVIIEYQKQENMDLPVVA